MQERPEKKQYNNKRTLLLLTLSLTAVTIPLHNNWNSWAIIGFVFAALIQMPSSDHIKKLNNTRYWIISVCFFFWMVATWLWDNQNTSFFKTIEIYASFLALPIVFTIIPKLTWREIAIICHAFIATIIILCMVCLVKAANEYNATDNKFAFSYHYLSSQVNLSAVYLSNYCIAGITWLFYFHFTDKRKRVLKLPMPLIIISILFLFVMVFLLSVKMLIVIMLLMMLFFLFYITKFKKLFITIPAITLVIIFSILATQNLTYLKFRLTSTKLKMYSGPQDDQNGLAARLLMWQSALELIKENPITGYGLVRSRTELLNKYKEKKFNIGYANRYNVHNQYLETLLNSGVIGLFLFLWLLFMPLAKAIQDRQLLLVLLLLHYMLHSTVESTLTVQQQQIFFGFFIWLFYFHYSQKNNEPSVTIAGKE